MIGWISSSWVVNALGGLSQVQIAEHEYQQQLHAAYWASQQMAQQAAYAKARHDADSATIDGTCEEVPEIRLLSSP